ncbi:MAG: pyridoxamine 5'-phosphate oxidase family protein [Pseudomonadota bacterium]
MQKIPMRKTQREITDPAQIEDILRQAQVLRLAMCRDGQPYVVPLSFAYHAGHIYVHTGRVGLKMDFLRANPKVCFEVSLDTRPAPGPRPCAWNCFYRSVIGFGRAVELEDEQERSQGLLAIVAHYAGPGEHELTPESLGRTAVLRIDIESLTGKQNLEPPAGA